MIKERIIVKNVIRYSIGNTYFSGSKKSALDHVYSNKPEKMSKICILNDAISDHLSVRYMRYTKYICYRSYKNLDKDKFKDDLEKDVELFHVCISTDTNLATNHLRTVLLKCLDKYAPFKKVQIRTNYVPYLSESTKDLQRGRDKLCKLARDNSNPENWLNFRKVRNKVINESKKD